MARRLYIVLYLIKTQLSQKWQMALKKRRIIFFKMSMFIFDNIYNPDTCNYHEHIIVDVYAKLTVNYLLQVVCDSLDRARLPTQIYSRRTVLTKWSYMWYFIIDNLLL